MHYLSLIVILLQLFSAGDIAQVMEDGWFVKSQEQRPFDYAVTYKDNGAEVVMPKVEGRSPIYSTQSIGDGQFLLLYEKTLEDGTVSNRYDLLDVKNKTLRFLSKSSSQSSGTYGLGTYVKAAELLIQTYAFESIESVNKKGEVKALAGQHGWSNQSPDGRFLAVQSGLDSDVVTTLYDLVEGTSVDCPLVPKMDYVFSFMAVTFSPDSRYFFSMPEVWGDRINIFESATGDLVDSIYHKGAIMSNPRWSPDGERLSYLIQDSKEDQFQVETTNLVNLFCSHFGLYSIADKQETKIKILEDRLVYSANFGQADDVIFLKTVTKESCLQWVKDREMPSFQPVNLDIYSIDQQKIIPIIQGVLEGVQETYWLNIEGLCHQNDLVIFYRVTGPSASELVSLDLNTGQEAVIRAYPEVVQTFINKDWLYIMSSAGLDRINLSGDITVHKVNSTLGVLTPEEDAYFYETTAEDKTVLHILMID